MINFFLNKLRKLFKSIGKLENNIIDKLTLLEKEKNPSLKNYIIRNKIFTDFNFQLKNKKNYPTKLAIVICFYFNQKKIEILRKTIREFKTYKFKIDLTLITNELSQKQKKILGKLNNFKIRNFNIYEAKEIPDNNLLPWYSINIMKKKYKDKSFSHFMFIEDDILINSKNICYWVYFRKFLKKYKLVPGFLRYENYKKNFYAVDYPKKIFLNKCPKILAENTNFGFINPRLPYSAMYLMDRELMKEYLSSNATKIDFSFSNNYLKSKAPTKELLNISHAFLNVPKGFFNKLMIPFLKDKNIPKYCLIEHTDIKYANSKKLKNMGYGKIKIRDLIN